MKQRNQLKKEKKGGRNRVTLCGDAYHACQPGERCSQGGCSPKGGWGQKGGVPHQWQERVKECVQKEKSWFEKYAQVQLVERPDCAPEVNEVPQGSGNGVYEVVTVTLDSGAYNTVGPRKVGSYFPVKPTEASQTGKHFSAANGSVIRNYGQRVIQGRSEEGATVTMPIQVADVGKVLGSAREFLDTGNRIALDRDEQGRSCSYLEHKATGHRTVVNEVRGTFQFNIRVPKGTTSESEATGVQEVKNSEGFPRQ